MSNDQQDTETVEQIVQVLDSAGRSGITGKELRAAVRRPEDQLERAFRQLSREGRAVLWARRWYLVQHSRWKVGELERLNPHESVVRLLPARESGEVISRAPASSFRVAEKDRHGARTGDRVLVRPLARRSSDRGSGKAGSGRRSSARGGSRRGSKSQDRWGAVVRVLDRARRSIVGRLTHEGKHWRLWSWSRRLALETRELVIEPRDDLEEGQYAVVELLEDSDSGVPTGRVTELLGKLEEAGTDTRVVLRHYEIPETFSAEVLAEAQWITSQVSQATKGFDGERRAADRVDLRERCTVTIDGEDARDFDDAISVEPLERGGFRVAVHIADVSHWVRPGGAIDRQAYARGTSVYFPERAVHMLPPALSENLCSLRPGEDRLTLTVRLDVTTSGEIADVEIFESVIRSRTRLTYSEVQEFFGHVDGGDLAAANEMTPEVGSLLLAARQAAALLRRRRFLRAALDFDLPLPELTLDERGEIIDYQGGERWESHRLIEELMIGANAAVARHLVAEGGSRSTSHDNGSPVLFRVNPEPAGEDLESVAEVARGLGLMAEEESLGAGELADLVRRSVDDGTGGLVSRVVLRALKRAVYQPLCEMHFALAEPAYCHFTSPIRRYPDLVVHRRIKGTSLGESTPTGEEMGRQLSWLERRAERAERDLREWKKLRYLARSRGEGATGVITGVEEFGLFVVLADLAVDGLVPRSSDRRRLPARERAPPFGRPPIRPGAPSRRSGRRDPLGRRCPPASIGARHGRHAFSSKDRRAPGFGVW